MDKLRQAKSIDLVFFLSSCGIHPQRESANRLYYNSPFRDEKSPSFVVYKDENRFYDWGEAWGGDVIDIAARMWGVSLSEAIDKLLDGFDVPKYFKAPPVIDRIPAIEVLDVADNLVNKTLISYMEDIRRIPISVVNLYCEEVIFQFQTSKWNKHIGVGVKNDAGGYSIRSTWFKGSTAPAGMKTIKSTQTDELYMFEGFIDFLSYVVMHGEPEHTTVILNSTVFITMIIDVLQGLDKVHVYVDNDHAGDSVVDDLMSDHVNVVDHRNEFSEFNDLNAKLQSGYGN